MEMFGFIDTPGTAVAPPRRLVETPLPHSPDKPPDGRADRLQTAVKADPFEDWEPEEVGRGLTTGRVRWGVLVTMLVILGAVGAAAAWIYQLPRAEARAAREEMVESANALIGVLGEFEAVNASLAASSMDTSRVNTALLSLDAGTRRLFEAAGSLSQEDSEARLEAIAITGLLAEAQGLFTSALTYRSAVIPALVPPALPTDPELVTLEDGAEILAEWEARLDSVRNSLPEGPLAPVTTRLNVISASLPNIQRTYLDAIGEGDPDATAAATRVLNLSLQSAERLLFSELARFRDEVAAMITEADQRIRQLPDVISVG
jgi:hypothetical protein